MDYSRICVTCRSCRLYGECCLDFEVNLCDFQDECADCVCSEHGSECCPSFLPVPDSPSSL